MSTEDPGLAARLRAAGEPKLRAGDMSGACDMAIAEALDWRAIALALLKRSGGLAVIGDDELDETDDDEAAIDPAEIDGQPGVKIEIRERTKGAA